MGAGAEAGAVWMCSAEGMLGLDAALHATRAGWRAARRPPAAAPLTPPCCARCAVLRRRPRLPGALLGRLRHHRGAQPRCRHHPHQAALRLQEGAMVARSVQRACRGFGGVHIWVGMQLERGLGRGWGGGCPWAPRRVRNIGSTGSMCVGVRRMLLAGQRWGAGGAGDGRM